VPAEHNTKTKDTRRISFLHITSLLIRRFEMLFQRPIKLLFLVVL
jgi:hypothetical protein